MPIQKHDPFREIGRFFEEEDWAFPAFRRRMGPPVDIYQKDDNLIAEMPVHKADPNKINVAIEDDVLNIRDDESEDKEDEDKNYYRKEIRRGSFVKSIRLPMSVKEEKIEAVCENGMLRITMPLSEESKKKRKEIEVKIK